MSGSPAEPERLELWRLERFRSLRPDLAAVMVERFASTATGRLAEARSSLEQGDVEAASLALHALKGSAATVGARLLSDLGAEAERSVLADSDPTPVLERIEREVPRTLAALRRAVESSPDS